jgi:hypothetical protein
MQIHLHSVETTLFFSVLCFLKKGKSLHGDVLQVERPSFGLSCPCPGGSAPILRSHLHQIPGTPQWRSVGQIKIGESLNVPGEVKRLIKEGIRHTLKHHARFSLTYFTPLRYTSMLRWSRIELDPMQPLPQVHPEAPEVPVHVWTALAFLYLSRRETDEWR